MNEGKRHWQFSFDLDQHLLKESYRKRASTYAYTEIRSYLYRNGFDNREDKQGSCYFTSEKMTYTAANRVIRNMYKELPWMVECIEKDSLTEKNVEQYSNKGYIQYLKKTEAHKERLKEYHLKQELRAIAAEHKDISPKL